MAVPIRRAGNDRAIEAGAPTPLFLLRAGGPADYIASADGQRFLVNHVVAETTTPPITMILNWKPKP
jgi:hypothetical protein